MVGSCGLDWPETGLSRMNQQPCALSVDDSAAARDTLFRRQDCQTTHNAAAGHMTSRKFPWPLRFSVRATAGSTGAITTTTTTTMKPAPAFRLGQLAGLPRLCLRQKHTQHSGKPRQATSGFVGPEGHGEKIWVFAHRRSDQIIYSFKEQLDVSGCYYCIGSGFFSC
jgi:hypothetical protein